MGQYQFPKKEFKKTVTSNIEFSFTVSKKLIISHFLLLIYITQQLIHKGQSVSFCNPLGAVYQDVFRTIKWAHTNEFL